MVFYRLLIKVIFFLIINFQLFASGSNSAEVGGSSPSPKKTVPFLIIDCQKIKGAVQGSCWEHASYAIFRLNFLENAVSLSAFTASFIALSVNQKYRFVNFWQNKPNQKNQFHSATIKKYSRLFSQYLNKNQSMLLIEIGADQPLDPDSLIISDVHTFLNRMKIKHYFYFHPQFDSVLAREFYAQSAMITLRFGQLAEENNYKNINLFLQRLPQVLPFQTLLSPFDWQNLLLEMTSKFKNLTPWQRLLIFNELVPAEWATLINLRQNSLSFRLKFRQKQQRSQQEVLDNLKKMSQQVFKELPPDVEFYYEN